MKHQKHQKDESQGRISSKELKFSYAFYQDSAGDKKPKDKEKKKDYSEERKRKRGE
jgi:hypothetical protein